MEQESEDSGPFLVMILLLGLLGFFCCGNFKSVEKLEQGFACCGRTSPYEWELGLAGRSEAQSSHAALSSYRASVS